MDTFKTLKTLGAEGKHICVGIDPDPVHVRKVLEIPENQPISSMHLQKYAFQIISQTHEHAAAFKPNFWFWALSVEELAKIIAFAKQKSPAPIILDCKVGDIGNTVERAVALANAVHADAVTVNPYMGSADVTKGFLKAGIDCFVLGRTSNPGAKDFQDLQLQVERTSLCRHVAYTVNKRVESGEPLGLVVGATNPQELKLISRSDAVMTPFLIPGVGAQGGDLATVTGIMKARNVPWVVNVGRGIAEITSDPNDWNSDAMTRAIMSMNHVVNTTKPID